MCINNLYCAEFTYNTNVCEWSSNKVYTQTLQVQVKFSVLNNANEKNSIAFFVLCKIYLYYIYLYSFKNTKSREGNLVCNFLNSFIPPYLNSINLYYLYLLLLSLAFLVLLIPISNSFLFFP